MLGKTLTALGHVLARLGVRAAGSVLPTPVIRAVFRRAVSGYSLAVCIHRVGKGKRRFDPAPEMMADPQNLDKLLELVDATMPQGSFYMTVDDGYADGVGYVADRAQRYPRINWLVFVFFHNMISVTW